MSDLWLALAISTVSAIISSLSEPRVRVTEEIAGEQKFSPPYFYVGLADDETAESERRVLDSTVYNPVPNIIATTTGVRTSDVDAPHSERWKSTSEGSGESETARCPCRSCRSMQPAKRSKPQRRVSGNQSTNKEEHQREAGLCGNEFRAKTVSRTDVARRVADRNRDRLGRGHKDSVRPLRYSLSPCLRERHPVRRQRVNVVKKGKLVMEPKLFCLVCRLIMDND